MRFYTNKEVFEHYENQGFKAGTAHITRALQNLGYHYWVKKINGKTHRGYIMKDLPEIDFEDYWNTVSVYKTQKEKPIRTLKVNNAIRDILLVLRITDYTIEQKENLVKEIQELLLYKLEDVKNNPTL